MIFNTKRNVAMVASSVLRVKLLLKGFKFSLTYRIYKGKKILYTLILMNK